MKILNIVSRVASGGVSFVKKVAAPVACALGIASVAAPQAQAAISLAPITDGIAALDTAALAAAATVIGVAVGWFALKFGGKWIIKVFKSMTS